MWVLFGVFLVLWVVAIHFYFPVWAIVLFFAAMIGALALALFAVQRQPSSNYISRTYDNWQ